MKNIKEIKDFVFAGNAYFTIQNTKTGKRFTYRVKKPRDFDYQRPVYFVSVLTGPDNSNDYQYMGTITKQGFNSTKRSNISKDSLSFKAFNWFIRQVRYGVELPDFVTFTHAGRCGCCGRLLTTPESVESGYGPQCIKRMGV